VVLESITVCFNVKGTLGEGAKEHSVNLQRAEYIPIPRDVSGQCFKQKEWEKGTAAAGERKGGGGKAFKESGAYTYSAKKRDRTLSLVR